MGATVLLYSASVDWISAHPSLSLSLPFHLTIFPSLPWYYIDYINTHMPNKQYYCDCKRRCGGIRRKVARSTYFAHAPLQDHFSQFSPAMQNFLKEHPITTHASSSPNAQSSCIHMGGTSAPMSAPPNKQMHHSLHNASHADIAVDAFGRVLASTLIILM